MIMQALKKYGWAFIGLFAMLISVYFLSRQNISLNEIAGRLAALSWHHWVLAGFFTLVAYAALAGYDRIALRHLEQHHISWAFITLCSFTTYALSHFIGASAFSGALVRYRAYSSKGLSGGEIALLVAFCSFTFILGTLLLMGLVLTIRPDLIFLVYDGFSIHFSRGIGIFLLALVGLYILGSLLKLKPLKIGAKFQITYPRPHIVLQQLIIGPLELLGAAGIIYAVLPDAGNPGFITVLGVFLASFTATLLINAPAGGVGVLELIFIKGMPGMNETDVLAALAVFHLLYQIVPLILSLFIVAFFEGHQFFWRRKVRAYRRRMEEEKAVRRHAAAAEAQATEISASTASAAPADSVKVAAAEAGEKAETPPAEAANAAAAADETEAAAELAAAAEQTVKAAPQKAKAESPAF